MPNQKQSKPISWRKIAGTFTLRRQDGSKETIGRGQIFLALPEEIPLAFRDTIVPVDPAELEAQTNPPLDVVSPGYRIVAAKLPGRFNVTDASGKVMNEKGLTKIEAQKLLDSLA